MRLSPVTTQKLEIVTFLQWLRGMRPRNPAQLGQTSGMKKHIREMIDDLKHPKANNDFVPPPAPVVPDDLSNQVLSKNAEEKVKQLDYQSFESERLQTNS
jgi:hypothetical protein